MRITVAGAGYVGLVYGGSCFPKDTIPSLIFQSAGPVLITLPKGECHMIKMLDAFYGFECRLFQSVNRHFDKKLLNLFFRFVTHFGGARFTIAVTLLLMLLSTKDFRLIVIASALSLSASHIPVHIVKQLLPRKRPYFILEETKVPANPLDDHSFPSGHTTAIFSIIVPYLLFDPQLVFVLLPLAISVGLSRIYLGLHYPSDVLAGGVLGTVSGCLSFLLLCL